MIANVNFLQREKKEEEEEVEEEKKKENIHVRETSISCLQYVPRPGIELTAFWCTGSVNNAGDTPPPWENLERHSAEEEVQTTSTPGMLCGRCGCLERQAEENSDVLFTTLAEPVP